MTTSLRSAFRKLRHNRFILRVFVLAGATTIAQGIVIAASPVLTRIFTPADFGLFSVFTSLLGVGAALATLRYEYALPVPSDDHEARSVLTLAIFVATAVAALCAIGVAIFGKSVADLVNNPTIQSYLWFLPIGIALVGTFSALSMWAIRVRDSGLLARTRLTQAVGSVLTQLGFGFSPVTGPVGLIVGTIGGYFASVVVLFRGADLWKGMRQAWPITWDQVREVAYRYRRFPTLSAPSAALSALVLYAPAFMIAAFYGPVTAGLFALTQQVLGLPMAVVGRAISDVFLGDAAASRRTSDLFQLRVLFIRTFLLLLVVSIITIGSVAAAAPAVFSVAFGTEWRDAGLYARALAPRFIMGLVAAPFGGVLEILERQDLIVARELIRGILVIGTLASFAALGASPLLALTALGLAAAIGYLAYVALTWFALTQYVE